MNWWGRKCRDCSFGIDAKMGPRSRGATLRADSSERIPKGRSVQNLPAKWAPKGKPQFVNLAWSFVWGVWGAGPFYFLPPRLAVLGLALASSAFFFFAGGFTSSSSSSMSSSSMSSSSSSSSSSTYRYAACWEVKFNQQFHLELDEKNTIRSETWLRI